MTKCVKIDGDSKITDLIYVFDDFVPSEDCDRMIQWFHDNEDKHKDGVVNSGTGFLAWDAADPNHTNLPCSILSINGLEATSSCAEQNTYSLITGQSIGIALTCSLKPYRVEVNGNILIITSF